MAILFIGSLIQVLKEYLIFPNVLLPLSIVAAYAIFTFAKSRGPIYDLSNFLFGALVIVLFSFYLLTSFFVWAGDGIVNLFGFPFISVLMYLIYFLFFRNYVVRYAVRNNIGRKWILAIDLYVILFFSLVIISVLDKVLGITVYGF